MPKSSAAYIDTGADITASRHRGNAASADAFERSRPTHSTDRDKVFCHILASLSGMTSKEVATAMGKPLHVVSGRCAELKAGGHIRGTGQRRDGAEVLVACTGEQLFLGGAA